MRKYSNNASTTLAASLNPADGVHPATYTVAVENGAGELNSFPDLSDPDDYAYVTLQNNAGVYEIVKLLEVDLVSGTVTITRGTGAFPTGSADAPPGSLGTFGIGSRIELRTTAGAFDSVLIRDGDTIHGGVFGATPAEPASGSSTIVTRYSTDATADQADVTLATGEIALNAKTRKLYAGVVDGSNNPETIELYPGIFVGTATPTYATSGMLWFDTNAAVLALKVYDGSTWRLCFGAGSLAADLILANAVALAAKNAAGTDTADLIQLNASDEIIIGDADYSTTQFLSSLVEFGSTLRLIAGGAFGNWDFAATGFGNSLLTIVPSANSSGYIFTVKDASGTTRNFTLDLNGFLTVPALTPTADYHVATKKYVDDSVGAGVTILAAGNVLSGGSTIGTLVNVDSVVKNSTGQYTVTLVDAASSINNMVVSCQIDKNGGTDQAVTVYKIDASSFKVQIGTGSSYGYADNDFMFVVYDTGA